MKATCVDCSRVDELQARQLCRQCYARHKKDRTLEQFPRHPPGNGVPEIEGMTYRQLNYWAQQGYLRPTGGGRSGIAHQWDPAELKVARAMARLVAAGLSPAAAVRVARGEKEIAPGVKVLVSR